MPLHRGDLRSLWVGALTALLAGAAVAIAVLGNYSCSLTGVAISASLMPPAVNAVSNMYCYQMKLLEIVGQ